MCWQKTQNWFKQQVININNTSEIDLVCNPVELGFQTISSGLHNSTVCANNCFSECPAWKQLHLCGKPVNYIQL